MKCMDPVLCYTDGQKKLFRHYSLASPQFKAIHNLVFNCGKCIFCRKKNSYELAVRCVLHASLYKQNCFLTLTYDESKEGYNNELEYSDIQKFKKKLRRHCEHHYNKKIEIFNVHEYGKNGKKHWHLVVFNHDFNDKALFTIKNGNSLYISETLSKLWTFGHHTIGDVTEASAMYQAQYTQKDIKNGNTLNKKKAHSKHSGIAKPYFLANYRQILQLGYIPFQNKKAPIPRYFKKLAHKHYSHFYEQKNFFDYPDRKKLYTPFKPGEENIEIAELFITWQNNRKIKIKEMEDEWDDFINQNLFSNEKPEFTISGENYNYDQRNKNTNEKF